MATPQVVFVSTTDIGLNLPSNSGPINYAGAVYQLTKITDTNTGTVTIGVFKSTNAGLSWVQIATATAPTCTGGCYGFFDSAHTITFFYAAAIRSGNSSIATLDLSAGTPAFTVVTSAGPAGFLQTLGCQVAGSVIRCYWFAAGIQLKCAEYNAGWGSSFNVGGTASNQTLLGMVTTSAGLTFTLRTTTGTNLLADVVASGAVVSADTSVTPPAATTQLFGCEWGGLYDSGTDTVRFALQSNAPSVQAFVLSATPTSAPVWSLSAAWLTLYGILFNAGAWIATDGSGNYYLFAGNTVDDGMGTHYAEISYSKNGGAQQVLWSALSNPLTPPSPTPNDGSIFTASILGHLLQGGLQLDQNFPVIGEFCGVTFYLQATDGNYLSLTCPVLDSAALNVPYSGQLVAVGGTPPLTYAIIGGSLPPGLTLDPATGIISGKPTSAGSFAFTAQVTDADGYTATAECSGIASPPYGPPDTPGGLQVLPGTLIYVLNYRELDTAEQIAAAAPIHNSLSGKLIATDHTRKWTRWNIPAQYGALMYREYGKLSPVFLFDVNAYTLDAAQLTDDDLGQIVPYYTTYFFVTADQEGQLSYMDPSGQRMPLGSGRKLLSYLKAYIAAQDAQAPGTCQVTITPFVDSLSNPWALVGVRTLTNAPKFDIEWGGGMVTGDRIALKIASSPITGTDNGFTLQRLTAFLKRAQRLQVRGAAR